jgi:hypothetical protein
MPSILERPVSSSLIFLGTVVQRGNSMVPNLRPSENPDTPAAVGKHGLAVRALLRSVLLAGVGWLAIAVLVDVVRPAAAAPVWRSSGIGTATSSAKQPTPPTPERRHRLIPGSPSSSGGPIPPCHLDRHPAPARCRRERPYRASRLRSPAPLTASARRDAVGAAYPRTLTPPPAAPRSSSWSIRSSRSQTRPASSCVAAA